MMHRLLVWTAVAAFTLGGLIAPMANGKPELPAVKPTEPEMVKWKLEKLHLEPLKLIKATPNPVTGQVRFLVEFTRRPELSETFDWEHRGGPVVFRFADEDGVVIQISKPTLEGEFLPEKGARIRLILQMPSQQILNSTRSITAD